jgi:hypothetical protein
MTALGMDDEQIESVIAQAEYERGARTVAATRTRKDALSTVALNGHVYDTNARAILSITKTVRLAEEKNAAETTTANWRLADNTSRLTTLAELRQLLALDDAQFVDVWDQFNAWLAGDRDTAFKVV